MKAYKLPPGPKGLPVLGNFQHYVHDPLKFLRRVAAEYGDITYYKVGPVHVCLVNHPDYIRDVLVTNSKNFVKGGGTEWLRPLLGEGLLTSEGEYHLRQRRLMQPAFHKQRINAYAAVMSEYAAQLSEMWREGATVNMAEEMMGLTLRVAGKTLFDTDVESERRVISRAVTVGMAWWRTFMLPFPNLLHNLPLPINRNFEQARGDLDRIVYRLIREHREGGKDRGDLLSMLLMAQDSEGNGERMTDRQVRDEAITILLAGHETTANALAWTFYLLSQNPDAEKRLHAELDEVLAGRLPTVGDIPKLPYTEMVLSESMRLYPPAWGLGRRALNDYEIGGYVVPKDTVVAVSQWVMHHDPRYYPYPFKFDPMRWTPEQKARRPRFAYFPFGGGNRICIGEQFAWMEGTLVLATLAQQWQARLVPGHKVGTQPLVTLRPKGGMPMTLTKRVPAHKAEPDREAAVA